MAFACAAFAQATCRTTSLSPAEAHKAAREGAAMAVQRAMYDVKPWVVWESKDPLRAEHGHAGVDAIIAETPYERVRYQAFLYALQGTRLNASQVEAFRRDAAGRLGFLLYAHSKTAEDRGFLRRFGPATLTAGTTRLTTSAGEFFGPSSDFYDVGTFRENRWVGSFTYRFRTNACIDGGELEFSGPYGERYRNGFALSRVPQ